MKIKFFKRRHIIIVQKRTTHGFINLKLFTGYWGWWTSHRANNWIDKYLDRNPQAQLRKIDNTYYAE